MTYDPSGVPLRDLIRQARQCFAALGNAVRASKDKRLKKRWSYVMFRNFKKLTETMDVRLTELENRLELGHRIEFVDVGGQTRHLVWENGDEALGITPGWVVEEEKDGR